MSTAEAAHRPAHRGRTVKLWLAFLILIAAGIGWGLLAGLVLNYLLLHEFRHRARPVRVRRPR